MNKVINDIIYEEMKKDPICDLISETSKKLYEKHEEWLKTALKDFSINELRHTTIEIEPVQITMTSNSTFDVSQNYKLGYREKPCNWYRAYKLYKLVHKEDEE